MSEVTTPLQPVTIGGGGRINPDAKPSRPSLVPEPEAATAPKTKWVRKTVAALRPCASVLSTLSEMAGIGAVSAGFWQMYPPSGLIAGGIGLIMVGVAAGLEE
jgi:hypothetical protein